MPALKRYNGSSWDYLSGGTPGEQVGTIIMFGSTTAPNGYILCDGSAISRTAFATLFGAIGTTYGAGNGTTTFNLPNFTNAFAYGNTPGSSGGSSTHTHPLSDNGAAAIVFSAVAAPNIFIRRSSSAGSWTPTTDGAGVGTVANFTTPQTLGAGLYGNTDSQSTLPPYTGAAHFIRYLPALPTTSTWTIASLTVSGVNDPAVNLSDLGGNTATVQIASSAGDGLTDSLAGDLVIKSSGRIRLGVSGETKSRVTIGPRGIEAPDTNWHYFGTYGEPLEQTGSVAPWNSVIYSQTFEYGAPRFRIDDAGIVWVEGLLDVTSAIAPGTAIYILPPGYRPAYTKIFPAVLSGIVIEVRIDPSGNISLQKNSTSTGYLSLDRICYPAEDGPNPPVWTDLSGAYLNTFGNYSDTVNFSKPRAYKDANGDVHLSGLITPSTSKALTTALQLPSGFYPGDNTDVFMTACSTGYTDIRVGTTGLITLSGYSSAAGSGYISLDGMILANFDSGFGGYPIVTYANSWASFGAGFPGFTWYINKSGTVRLRGLIKSGTVNTSVGFNPSGFTIPGYRKVFIAPSATATNVVHAARVDVANQGSVLQQGVFVQGYIDTGSNTWVSMSGIAWSTKP